MKIGLVSDVHEAVEELAAALGELRRRGADVVVSLGDACDVFQPRSQALETVMLLREAGAVGVWGNHDMPLCMEVDEKVRQRYDPAVLEYMAGMRPRLVLEDCHFSHVEPWLDPMKAEELWYFEGPPDTPEKVGRSLAAVPQQTLFVGHMHRWLAADAGGCLGWQGTGPLELAAGKRHLVVVAAVVDGSCGVFDTQSRRLEPIRL